jgi:hypothetical protein
MAIEKVQDAQEEPKKVVERTEKKSQVITESAKVETPTISMEEVHKLLEQQKAEFQAQLKEIKAATSVDSKQALINEEQEDYMDDPATFFVFASSYSILGDKIRGKETLPPNGKIRFTNVLRTRTRGGNNGDKIISISSHVTNSKATAEWLRNCTAFGLEIFEDMNTVHSVDADWAQRLVAANSVVQNFSDHAVLSRCRQEGIPISTDLQNLRRELTTVIAKKNEDQYKHALKKRLEKANIEEDRIVTNAKLD